MSSRRGRGLTGSALVVGALFLGACATVPQGPSVMVMPPPGKPIDAFQADDNVCRQYASNQVGTSAGAAATGSTATGAVLGTLIGAGAGAALGAIGGHAATGAAVGAGVGLLGGTAVGAGQGQAAGNEAQRRYDIAYQQCMYEIGRASCRERV